MLYNHCPRPISFCSMSNTPNKIETCTFNVGGTSQIYDWYRLVLGGCGLTLLTGWFRGGRLSVFSRSEAFVSAPELEASISFCRPPLLRPQAILTHPWPLLPSLPSDCSACAGPAPGPRLSHLLFWPPLSALRGCTAVDAKEPLRGSY